MTQLNTIVEMQDGLHNGLESLVQRYSRASLATEEFSGENIVSALTQTLGYVKQSFSKLSDTLTQFRTDKPKIVEVQNWGELEQRRFAREIMGLNYFTFSDMQIAYTPEGMYKTYLEYYEALRPLCEHVNVSHKTIIHPYVSLLAGLLSEVSSVLRTSKDNTVFYESLEKNREGMKDKLLACYKAGSEKDVRRVSEVIKRNADWAGVFTIMNECDKMIKSIDVNKIQEDVKLACTYIDSIISKLESSDTDGMQKSNKEVLTVLSSGAYQMSNEVELIPLVIFKNSLIVSAVLRTAQAVNTTVLGGKVRA